MEQKEAEQEVRHYVEGQLPSAIFVLKELISDKHEYKPKSDRI